MHCVMISLNAIYIVVISILVNIQLRSRVSSSLISGPMALPYKTGICCLFDLKVLNPIVFHALKDAGYWSLA